MEDLKYPIGKFTFDPDITTTKRRGWIAAIEALPERLRQATEGLFESHLDLPYRPEGWTLRQVIHHVADSHMNAFVRFKLALTEEQPTIKPYKQDAWANSRDAAEAPVELSLNLVTALHARWALLLRNMQEQDFKRKLEHPEVGLLDLDRMLQLYVWHGEHHTAHILELRKRQGL